MSKDRILTGIRANDMPHIGNYLGAFLPIIELQQKYAGDYDVNMFVPDLHSFTTPINHDELYQNTIRNLKFFVAAGLDIEDKNTYIYRQSYIPAHSELAWILDCFAYFGEMSRMTQFKDKSGGSDIDLTSYMGRRNLMKMIDAAGRSLKGAQLGHEGDLQRHAAQFKGLMELIQQMQHDQTNESSVSVGLFNYPVLMAADILLYNAKYVPVGDDQKQHLEITRDIALRINEKFKPVFPDGVFQQPPLDWKAQLTFTSRDNGVRIRSLRNPEKKMSKSVSDPAGTILLSDDPAEAAKKIMSATTDSFGSIKFDFADRPGISNLLQMLALFTKRPQQAVNAEWEGKERYGDLKKAVAEAVEAFLIDFQTKVATIDETTLITKLEQDEAVMRDIADATLLRVQQAVGLRPRTQL